MYRRLLFSLGLVTLFGVPMLGAFTAPQKQPIPGAATTGRDSESIHDKTGDNLSSTGNRSSERLQATGLNHRF